MQQGIYLIGPRAAGKTTVGLAVAKRLGMKFIDTDACLFERSGKTVAEIVSEEGWEGFRKKETEVLFSLGTKNTVVATGGGIILADQNRKYLKSNGIVIYLFAPVETLIKRLSFSPENALRPSLTGKTIQEEIRQIAEERDPLYRQTSHYIVASNTSLAKVTEAILSTIKSHDGEKI